MKNSRIYPKLKVKSPKTSNFRQIHYPAFAGKSSKKKPDLWVVGHDFNRLDESTLMGLPKPMLTEFGIYSRFESCDQSRVEPEIVDSTSNDLGVNDNQLNSFRYCLVKSTHRMTLKVEGWNG